MRKLNSNLVILLATEFAGDNPKRGYSFDEIALASSDLRFSNIINDWYRLVSRIRESTPASITPSRTMIENLYTAILKALRTSQNEIDRAKGDLGKLHKAVCKELDVDELARKIVSGLSSIIYGISEISNMTGDRHGGNYENVAFEMAEFIVYIVGSISVFIYKMFLCKIMKVNRSECLT